MANRPIAAGHSSYSLIESRLLLSELPLSDKTKILDAAAGNGSYTLAIAERLPAGGMIYAYDLWQEGIAELKAKAIQKKLSNITAEVVDLRKRLPVDDGYFNVCLMATVWHDFIAEGTEANVIKEIKRVLNPNSLLAVVEFKKVDGPPGPPIKIRLAPAELEESLKNYGFKVDKTVSVGPYNYLSIFHYDG